MFYKLLYYSPVSPDAMDWSPFYPQVFETSEEESSSYTDRQLSQVEFADIGCGYGGLLGRNEN